MEIIRQGDVVLSRVDVDRVGDLEREPTTVIVEGEVTGHAHRVADGVIVRAGGRRFVAAGRADGTPARVLHEEHAPVEVPAGLWEVWRQREYEPRREPRTVRD
jgi:hypothetical protein